MGAYGANFGANYAVVVISITVPTKTTTASLCVDTSSTKDLCV